MSDLFVAGFLVALGATFGVSLALCIGYVVAAILGVDGRWTGR